jgi:hypothetical protein
MIPDKPAQLRQAEVQTLTDERDNYLNLIQVALIHRYKTPDLFVTLAREIAAIAKILVDRAYGLRGDSIR